MQDKPSVLGTIAAAGILLLSASSAASAEETAAPASEIAEETTRSILVLNLTANNIDEETVAAIGSFVTVAVSKQPGLKVLEGEDVKRMVQLHADKHQMGCDDTACAIELAGALGAELVLHGQVGRLEKRLLVTLSLVDVSKAEAVNRETVTADDLDSLPEQLEPTVAKLVSSVTSGPGTSTQAQAAAQGEDGGGATWPWLVAAGGGVLMAAGTAMAVVGITRRMAFDDGRSALEELESAQSGVPTDEELNALSERWQETETARTDWNSWGVALVGVGAPAFALGAAGLAGGIALGMMSGEEGEEDR